MKHIQQNTTSATAIKIRRAELVQADAGDRRRDEIVVGFGVDEAYARHLAVTIVSIVDAAPDESFRFVVMHGGVSEASQAQIESCAPGAAFDWRLVTDEKLLALAGRDYISQATFYRFLLTEAAPASAKRVIYLDSDLVVLKNLRGLWETDLQGNIVGAVFDAGINADEFADQFRLSPERLGYFNAGVLLLDLERIRSEQAFAPVVDALTKHSEDFFYMDQDAMNLVFWKQWTLIDPRWNMQRRMFLRAEGPCYPDETDVALDGKPAILHYTEKEKPWVPGAFHSYMWAYFKYAKKTPFWDETREKSGVSSLRFLKWRIKDAWLNAAPSRAFQPRLAPEDRSAEDIQISGG